ncbi:MAG: hypothetical protein ACOZBW_05680 [Thermodesulfobacteriota bacterium]
MSKNGFNHGVISFASFIQIEIGIAIGIGSEIEFNVRWAFKKFFLFSLCVYFSCRQEKDQKNRAPRLGLRLSSRKRFFRRGQELARLRRAQTACPLVFRKTACARLRRKGRKRSLTPMLNFKTPFHGGTLFLILFSKFVNSDGYKHKTPFKS